MSSESKVMTFGKVLDVLMSNYAAAICEEAQKPMSQALIQAYNWCVEREESRDKTDEVTP